MATLPTLRPTGTVSNTGWSVSGAATAHEATDDDPNSHNSDTDYITTAAGAGGAIRLALSDMPSDFASMDSITVKIVGKTVNWSDDTLNLESVLLSGSLLLDMEGGVTRGASQWGTGYSMWTIVLTPRESSNTKTNWDNASLRLTATYSNSMGSDGATLRITAVEVDGTYTPAWIAESYPDAVTSNTNWANPTDVIGDTDLTAHLAAFSSGIGGVTSNVVSGTLVVDFDIPMSITNISNVTVTLENSANTGSGLGAAVNVAFEISFNAGSTWHALRSETGPSHGYTIYTVDVTANAPTTVVGSQVQVRATGSVTSGTGAGVSAAVNWRRARVQIAGTEVDATPPSTPTGLTATPASSTQVDTSWTASTDDQTAQGSLVYEVERSTTSASAGFSLVHTTAAGVVTWNDTGRTPGTQYWYRVRAKDAANNYSGYATVDDAITPNPPTETPTLTIGTITDTSVAMSTSAVTLATSYEFQRDTVTQQNTSSQSFTDTGLTPETTYSYRVRGVNADGAGPWSTAQGATTTATPAGDGTATRYIRFGGATRPVKIGGVSRAVKMSGG